MRGKLDKVAKEMAEFAKQFGAEEELASRRSSALLLGVSTC